MMTFIKFTFIFLGTLSLCLGLVGIFIPGLPTTPFLLLTAALYIKSSDRLYQMVIDNKYVGAYIYRFRSNKGMSKRDKIFAISLMWIMIAVSCTFLIDAMRIRLIITVVGIIGTVVMGFIVPISKQ